MDNLRGKYSFKYDLADIDRTCMVAKALSSPVRLEILKLLVSQSMTMGELAQALYVSLSSVSMHTKVLQEAGLITVVPKPGMHGAQKICGIRADKVLFDFFAAVSSKGKEAHVILNIPIGCYSEAEIVEPCGLVNSEKYLDVEDNPYAFYNISHTDAQLIWFTSGHLKYPVMNKAMAGRRVKSVDISFEVCAEALGYNNDWPSDIYLKINGHKITTFRVKGDYGGIRGVNNPQWWSDSNTQYGELKILSLTQDGSFLNGQKVSALTIEDLDLRKGYCFFLEIGVDERGECVGGMNLFGKNFGNIAQDIRVEFIYK